MKITCLHKHLKEAVSVADRSTSKNQTLQILNSLLLVAKNNELIIRATNLETAIELHIPCKVEDPGNIVVSGKILNGFLSNVSDEQISLQNQKNNLFIKTKSTQTTIRGFSSEDFPLFPSINPLFSCVLNSNELFHSLHSVTIASSTSDIKPELASVCFKIFKNNIKFAATDSFRLAEKSIITKKTNQDTLISFLIPNKSIQELLRLFGDYNNDSISSFSGNNDIELLLNKNQISFQSKTIKYISRLTDGIFPDYDQIIPKSFKTEGVFKKVDFISHIKLASVFVSRLNDLQLQFESKNKKLIFNSSHPDIGEHNSEIEGVISGESISSKFNWKYLLDGVTNIQSDFIILGFNGEQSPLLLKGKGDTTYLYLVMPMRGI